MEFEWNEAKAASNVRKHGIRFTIAVEVFRDPFAVFTQDRVVDGEIRWQATGVDRRGNLLLVAHVIRLDGDLEIVRIISARAVTSRERRDYERENG